MPKTHLPGHLDSVRQTVRPKHQVLINKCYPRLPKNSAADVKPNGSELSYLMYYAASRKSKLQKVGTFLERKTTSDVSKSQSAKILVTLDILTALLDNKAVGEGTGLALIAPYVMRIISGILENTNDVSLIDASQTTWNAFCKHQDQAILAADHEYRDLFEHTVAQYAHFAHKSGAKKLGKATAPVPAHDAIRLRETGLHAIKSVLTSDALAFESARTLLATTIPAILGNLHGDGAEHIQHLLAVGKRAEDEEKGRAAQPRQSIATVRTFTGQDTTSEPDPRAAEGTAQDADAIAEEGVAVVALDCLKAVFATDNRAQVRSATITVLKYLSDLQYYRRPSTSERQISESSVNTWATKVFELCTAWTPVQDRYILLITTVDALTRLPLKESDLRQHLLYTSLIDHVLRSDLNLIGLSVMDVLLQLIHQTLRVLQLNSAPPMSASSNSISNPEKPKTASSYATSSPEKPATATSHAPTTPEKPATATSPPNSTPETPTTASSRPTYDKFGQPNTSLPLDGTAGTPSTPRMYLMERLQCCIADLATHIYYTDQIADMIGAILLRLKPSPTSSGQQAPGTTAAAIDQPKTALSEVASNSPIPSSRGRANSTTSGYFSFDTAREVALDAVRDIIKVANSTRHHGGGGLADNRNPVHISIWEGTQWLMKDPSLKVRYAYVRALITWLELETNPDDFRLHEPNLIHKKTRHTTVDGNTSEELTMARRAVSNASAARRQMLAAGGQKTGQYTFLQLLHVANYDNAVYYAADSEFDIVMLHNLLATLVRRLGINAATSGLPMILHLQEDIVKIGDARAKVRIGCLVHGYLWQLVEQFHGDDAPAQCQESVMCEVRRRKDTGTWIEPIRVPPTRDSKGTVGEVHFTDLRRGEDRERVFSGMTTITEGTVENEELRPFDDREALVDMVIAGYQRSISSPPTSPPGSPGKSFATMAGEMQRASSNYMAAKKTVDQAELGRIQQARMEMMAAWTRDAALKSVAAPAPRSVSLSGQSRSSPQNGVAGEVAQGGNHRARLGTLNRRESDGGSSEVKKKAPTFEELKRGMEEDPVISEFSNRGNKPKVDVRKLLANLPVGDEKPFPKRGRPTY